MKMKHSMVVILILFSFGIRAQQDGLNVYIDVLDMVPNGQIEQAEYLIDSLEQSCLPDTNNYTYACALACRGKIISHRGNFEKAIDLRKRSINILEGLGYKGRALAIFYADLGFAMREIDDFNGLDYYLKANDIFIYLKDWGSLAQSYNTIFPFFKDEIDASGCLYFSELGLYYFRKANSVVDSTDAKTLIFLSSFEQAVAEAYALSNEDSAILYYHKALETIKKTNHPYATYYKYHGYMGISTIALQTEDYQTALEYINPTLKEFLKLGMENTQYHADIILYKGVIFNGLEMFDSAVYYLNQAIKMYSNVDKKQRWISYCYKELSTIEFKKENYNKALDYAHKAMFANSPNLEIPENSDAILPYDSAYFSQRNYTTNLLNKANIYFHLYKRSNDVTWLEKSYNVYKYYMEFLKNGYYKNTITLDRMSKEFNEDINLGISRYLYISSEMNKITGNAEVLNQSYQNLSTIKAGLMNEQSRKTYTTANPELIELQQRLVILKKQIKKYDFIRLHENISTDSLEKIHDLLARAYMNSLKTRKEIQFLEKKLQTDIPKNELSTKDLMASLNSDQAVLDYFYNDSLIYIFCVTKNGVNLSAMPITNDFKKKISLEYRYLKTADPRLEENSKYLYSILLEPVMNLIKNKNSLIIIPYDDLFTIPFEVLIDKKGKYLINNYKVSYHFSSQNLYLNKKENNQGSFLGYAPDFKGNVKIDMAMRNILFNDSTFQETNIFDIDRDNIAALPYAKEEASAIYKLFNDKGLQAELITDEKATETHFKENHKGFNIIHIASHGYASKLSPEISGVFFSNKSNTDNGYLFLSELIDLHLNADLIVLSACQSGQGKISGMEGAISLPRGFILAGVENVIASLWKVHDEKTKELMISFYKHLLKDQSGYSDALRIAKLECIKNGFLPMDWSGFVLFGVE